MPVATAMVALALAVVALIRLERKLMAIADQLAALKANQATIATGIQALDAKIVALAGQIAASPSVLTAEDQATLDAVVAQSAALASVASADPTATPPPAPPAT
jgi:capsule polysaccharide export protein KpsE/RkpR